MLRPASTTRAISPWTSHASRASTLRCPCAGLGRAELIAQTFSVLVRVVETLRQLFVEQGRLLDRTAQRCDARQEDTARLLRELWSLLQPDVELSSLLTKQWQDIGFQGALSRSLDDS